MFSPTLHTEVAHATAADVLDRRSRRRSAPRRQRSLRLPAFLRRIPAQTLPVPAHR
jgi:hypothetical protein